MHLVYGLFDPRNGHLRYVGKSTRGLERPKQHTTPYYLKKNTHVTAWVRSLLKAGLKPEIFVLEETTAARLNDVECFWIASMRAAGCDLTNHTAGGEGATGCKKSPAARAKLSASLKGIVFSKERVDSIRAALARDDVKQKMRTAKLGRKLTPEQRAVLSEAQKKRWALKRVFDNATESVK